MKRFFASIALMGLLTLGFANAVSAQNESEAAVDSTATTTAEAQSADQTVAANEDGQSVIVTEGGFHQALKTKFIEGGPMFMAFVSIALILGLAFALERIIYLNLADTNNKKFLEEIEAALDRNDVEGAKNIARNARGPVASIAYQALMRIDQGLDVVERAIVSYGGVQAGLLEKNLSWITLFIAMAPSLGFLGTVIGMVQAFDSIEQAGDISPTVVAGGMKVALITTIGGLIVALILQVFYNYLLSKYEGILNRMEDASISLVDFIVKYNVRNNKI